MVPTVSVMRNPYFRSYKTSLTHKRTLDDSAASAFGGKADLDKYKDVIISAWK